LRHPASTEPGLVVDLKVSPTEGGVEQVSEANPDALHESLEIVTQGIVSGTLLPDLDQCGDLLGVAVQLELPIEPVHAWGGRRCRGEGELVGALGYMVSGA